MNNDCDLVLRKAVGVGCKEPRKVCPCFCLNPHSSCSPLPFSLNGQMNVSSTPPPPFFSHCNKVVNSFGNKAGMQRNTPHSSRKVQPFEM